MCGKSNHITAVCMTKDPDRPDERHASQSFNGVNGPADGPHPGGRELPRLGRLRLLAGGKLPPHAATCRTMMSRLYQPAFNLPSPIA